MPTPRSADAAIAELRGYSDTATPSLVQELLDERRAEARDDNELSTP